jgi:acyl carrier protein
MAIVTWQNKRYTWSLLWRNANRFLLILFVILHPNGIMGLDSVELLMDIEDYFGITISDSEAEKIYTVQQMVDTVANLLNIKDETADLRDVILERVNHALIKLEITSDPINPSDFISSYLSPENKESWDAFVGELQLKVPKPDTIKENKSIFINKIMKVVHWLPLYDWRLVTVNQFIDAVCAMNYEKYTSPGQIKSKFEIYAAVCAITVNKIGVDYYEVTPEKSFTADLGID